MLFNRNKKNDEENSCIVPIKYDKKLNIGKLPDGTIVDLFQIVCKDLKNLDDVSNQMDILSWIKLYSTYADDLKITASFFPVDTSAQIRYFIMAMNGNNIVVKEIDAEKKQKYFYLLANKNLNF